jgi:hypothetical protein
MAETKNPFPKIRVFDNGFVGWEMNGKILIAGQSWKALALKNLKKKGKL